MHINIHVVAGSVIGTDHRTVGRNRQDAYWWHQESDLLIAVVCDGISSAPHSEVGAQLGAVLIGQSIIENIRRDSYYQELALAENPREQQFWTRVADDVLAQLRVLSRAMSSSLTQIVNDYLAFTSVAAIITPYGAIFAVIGDGVAVVNGTWFQDGPFPNNAPPCLAYRLIDSQYMGESSMLSFHVLRKLPLNDFDSFLIGSDGVAELNAHAASYVPGSEEMVGSISRFWREDIYFANPETINRKLRLINRDVNKIDPQTGLFLGQVKGLLKDDTTIIVGRMAHKEDL